MIYIGLGANLPSPVHGSPRETLAAALARIGARGIRVAAVSRWYSSAPVPPSAQPRYVNAAAALETGLEPGPLLQALHGVEREFGRVRAARNAPRVIDIDLLDFRGRVRDGWPALPHPRLAGRAFALRPLRDLAPGWRHPATGEGLETLLARARDRDGVRLLDAD